MHAPHKAASRAQKSPSCSTFAHNIAAGFRKHKAIVLFFVALFALAFFCYFHLQGRCNWLADAGFLFVAAGAFHGMLWNLATFRSCEGTRCPVERERYDDSIVLAAYILSQQFSAFLCINLHMREEVCIQYIWRFKVLERRLSRKRL